MTKTGRYFSNPFAVYSLQSSRSRASGTGFFVVLSRSTDRAGGPHTDTEVTLSRFFADRGSSQLRFGRRGSEVEARGTRYLE